MPLDPDVQEMLASLEAMDRPSLASGTVERAREGFRAITVDFRPPDTVIPVFETEDTSVPGAAGDLATRVYQPGTEGPYPTIVFFHGGGWVIGDLDTHDNQCRSLCTQVDAVVVSVAYRVAPEAPFPAAVEDCTAALDYVAEHVNRFGGDAERIAVAGDSAGGNLAAVTAIQARDADGPPIAAQLLIYPGTDFAATEEEYPSRAENAEGYFLTAEDMRWFDGHYTNGARRDDPRLSPLRTQDLSGLPPAVVVTAEFDPLRDEGEAYARALQDAGVPVVLHRYDGLVHGFFDLPALSPAAAEAVRETCADLRRLLDA